MNLLEWISKNNSLLIQTTKNITKNADDTMDLYQSVIEQLLEKPEKMNSINDEQKLYYFIKVIKNNYFSKTSPYKYHLEKYNNSHIRKDDMLYFDSEDTPYTEDIPDMVWVRTELDKMGWFEADLFTLWIEMGTLIDVHRETTIPINSVGKYIKEIKKDLYQRWINEKNKRDNEN